jgi:hypothetical protein
MHMDSEYNEQEILKNFTSYGVARIAVQEVRRNVLRART